MSSRPQVPPKYQKSCLPSEQSLPLAADCIIRSGDAPPIDFYVHKVILAYNSTFFGHLLATGTADSPRDPLVILVPELGAVLRPLLLLSYPNTAFSPFESVEQVKEVARTAQKYSLHAIHSRLEELVLSSELWKRDVPSSPIRWYAIGVVNHWEKLARAAARKTLFKPAGTGITSAVEETLVDLAQINGQDLQHLYDYHRACGEAANKALTQRYKLPDGSHERWLTWLPWFPTDSDGDPFFYTSTADVECRCEDEGKLLHAGKSAPPTGNEGTLVHKSVHRLLRIVASRLLTHPMVDIRKDFSDELSTLGYGLATCTAHRDNLFEQFPEFVSCLQNAVHDAISKVSCDIAQSQRCF